jgi:hypothetical protein
VFLFRLPPLIGNEILNSGTTRSIVAIFFVESNTDEAIELPFKDKTRFLGFESQSLLQKLVVLRPVLDNVQLRDSRDPSAGWRVLKFDGTQESARDLVHRVLSDQVPTDPHGVRAGDGHRAGSAAETPGENKLSETGPAIQLDNLRRMCTSSARAADRHRDQAVILLVGHSGHGKSKTINRLIGQNLLKVGKAALGSTTKVIYTWDTPCEKFLPLCPGHRASEGPH